MKQVIFALLSLPPIWVRSGNARPWTLAAADAGAVRFGAAL
jgi:hypothetical protein